MSGRRNGDDVVTHAQCGDPDLGARVRDYVLGGLDRETAERVEDHLAGCPSCSARVTRYEAGLRRLEGSARRPLRLPLLALAAALLVTAGMMLWRGTPTTSRGEGPWRSAGASIALLSPAGTIAAAPVELRWSAPDTFAACRAEIVRLDLSPVFEQSAVAPGRIEVPEGTRATLATGDPFLWRVRCAGPAGEASSSYAEFRVVTSRSPPAAGAPTEASPR